MKDYSRKEHKNHKKCNNIVPSYRIVLALLLLFWLSNHEYVGRAFYQGFINVSNKPLLVFVFMNLIIFTLCFLPSQKQINQPLTYYVVCDQGSNRGNSEGKNPLSDDDDEGHTEEEILEDKHIILVENYTQHYSESFEWNDHNYDDHELELRRLERGMIKEMAITMAKPPWTSSSMEDKSNEEFRFAIEAFISQRNKVMMQENFHDEEAIYAFSDQQL
ncbi:hypothetical protein CCACVL1_08947 [Corchorus capsularis]|uniref:Uncharacterized protein n=1 Tax=Corchorus capsularis TaxID=210143 RepID=A0A1R3IYA3_COCAP|nr:hypothetical protein CCACVL1_08947 [Corchorus capsularis]